ncbi:MAG: shikimate kinase [Rubrivivax sp.]
MLLALVGMPGSGKSTVGRHLARQLGCDFVDTDTELENRLGMPVRSFFELHGEEAFRQAEQEVVGELSRRREGVIATGGGAVLRPANREALRERARVVYLRASPEELYRRLRHDTRRPLLQVADPQGRLRELFRERDPLYRRTAHYVIEAARPTVPGLVSMILMQLEVAGLLDPARVPATIGRDAPAD